MFADESETDDRVDIHDGQREEVRSAASISSASDTVKRPYSCGLQRRMCRARLRRTGPLPICRGDEHCGAAGTMGVEGPATCWVLRDERTVRGAQTERADGAGEYEEEWLVDIVRRDDGTRSGWW